MRRIPRKVLLTAGALGVLAPAFAVIGAGPLAADTSSWFTRDTDTPARKLAPSPAAARDAARNESDAVSGSSEIKKNIPSTVPATGDDAAYTAFDQGQYLTALKLAEEAAARGEPQANTLIARIYGEGLGVQRDDRKAFEYYQKAAELGDVQGTFALGIALAEGRGVAKNRRAAADMFEKAALTGHAEANYNLGLLFLKGDGKPENPIRAFQHIRYAAEKGIPQAQYDLATLYQTGTGVEANALEAARWLSRAAEQGLTAAQYDYAVKLLQGFGLTKDEPKATALMKSVAEKGVPGAQNRLAHLYLEGIQTPKSTFEAAKWRLIAKKNGFEDKDLDDMIAKLPKAERQKAEVQASAWADRIQVDPTLDSTP